MGDKQPRCQAATMIKENANRCATSTKLFNLEFILILKQLLIDCSWIDINTGVFLREMCSDRCKTMDGCRQKIPEGTSSAMFDVRTIAKCYEFKRCTLTRFDVTRVTQVTVLR